MTDRPNDALLTKCEELAVEVYGLGVAVSLEEDKPIEGVVTAVVWSKKGSELVMCEPQKTRSEALRCLRRTLEEEMSW